MITTFVAALLALASVQSTDTIVPVREGMRLDLRNREGDIRVTAWTRDEVEIVAGPGSSGSFSVERSGDVLRVRAEPWRGRREEMGQRMEREDGGVVDFEIRVPSYLHLSLQGLESDVSVSGTAGDVAVETTDGSVEIAGGDGFVTVTALERPVRVRGARGRVVVEATEGDVTLEDVVGEITAASVDGNVELVRIDARRVEVTCVDGDVSYDGTVYDGGRYRFATHEGDVTLAVPPDANATVSVANYDGGFETEFPVTLRESQRRRFQLVIGDGSAEIVLETFDGDVVLRRR